MARVSRKSLKCKYYHVMVQGINKEYIFENDIQKSKYKDMIFRKAIQNEVRILAYCIMYNHAHILVKVEKSEKLSRMMAQVNSGYGKYYNKTQDRVGYVFRDRYRAEPIFNINHLQNCIRYIHENPVKANIVKICADYPFSSYNEYKKDLIDKVIIEEIYGKENNYIEKIEGEYEDYNFIEVNKEFGERDFEDFDVVCKEYGNINVKEHNNIYKISKELKKRTNVTNDKIIDFLQISRATYYNIMRLWRN